MSLKAIHLAGLYATVTLVGMVVAALAAYYILVEFIYPLKSRDMVLAESFSDITQARGVIVTIEQDSLSVSTSTILIINTDGGEEKRVRIPLQPNVGCLATNIVDPASLFVGDIIDVKGVDSDGDIFPCREPEHHVVKVVAAVPLVIEEVTLASSTASTTKEATDTTSEIIEPN